ncbi:uncharacterized protein EV154DRAFT_592250 [Mucor mucedo]|uniref:uncharacterized protein n=1 Tax=Mucor mucedo TaxID=29922 RepID=UPI00221E8AEC|nr:uncharacterized protein EV154DRAFT_592250 [Mucor mucedo]KAI7889446.1 hypothetical protein EV154DRAFT_592250 [Mucor mucedo]
MMDKDPICVLCGKAFSEKSSSTMCAIVCGHTFHRDCIDSWCKLLDYCPVCRKFLGEDFPYNIKFMYKDSPEKQSHEKTDHILKKFKQSHEHIVVSEGLLEKVKKLHEIFEELKSFFDSDDSD